ncbi:phospholipase A1 1-like [Sitodiplosis mosellana]|uniref:phospholipase A1 1-like n=1 Tax=Sitodiplosis mosellana TaxID=263140 RepID=UPI002443F5AC|nr:phospholipase A1 1-like [Sitodiplosis mosellana]
MTINSLLGRFVLLVGLLGLLSCSISATDTTKYLKVAPRKVGFFPLVSSSSNKTLTEDIGKLTYSLVPCSFHSPNPFKVEKLLKFGIIGHDYNINLEDVKDRSENYKKFANVIRQARNVTIISGGIMSNSFDFANNLKDRVGSGIVLYVNWDELNGGPFNYGTYAHNAPIIGDRTGYLIKTLADDGAIDVSKLIGVGFSLGAHIIGNMGYHLTQNKLQMAHIIALDPASPCFEDWNDLRSVQRDNAKLVQVIHTDAKWFGYERKIGHIDIYPNNGENQPECSMILIHTCWHNYSWKLYKLRDIKAGCAKNWDEFKKNNIDHTIPIGHDLSSDHLLEGRDCTYYLHSPKAE